MVRDISTHDPAIIDTCSKTREHRFHEMIRNGATMIRFQTTRQGGEQTHQNTIKIGDFANNNNNNNNGDDEEEEEEEEAPSNKYPLVI